jgi:hypothetical protein
MSRLLGFVAIGVIVAFSYTVQAGDIVLSGFNEDVVTENSATPYARRFDIWGACFIENGMTKGTSVGVGFPSSHYFTSASGSGVLYHLGPYNGNNALRLGDNDPLQGTLTVSPAAYSMLHVVSASGTDNSASPTVLGQTSDITLNFTNGSVTLPQALLAYDWDYRYSGAAANVKALNGLDRNVVGTAGSTVNLQFTHYFTLYETTLNLANLGLSGRTLQSITFNDTSVHQATSIFAVDGVVAAPEPASVSVLALLAGSLVFRPRRKSA